MQDPFADFKAIQRDGWKSYIPLETFTLRPAAHLVRVAGIQPGQRVLDVACGTGPVAITARRAGAKVVGLDLTPELLAHAKRSAALAEVDDITWKEGDAENLPFRDGEFDVVLSEFGHIFAPRPEVAMKELLRVLRPGGTLAFSTWPPEGAVGKLFEVINRYLPPMPGVPSPLEWGRYDVIRQRLGNKVRDVTFEHGALEHISQSPQHARLSLETTLAPVMAVLQMNAKDPAKLATIRKELEAALAAYHRDNHVRFEYVITRATKV